MILIEKHIVKAAIGHIKKKYNILVPFKFQLDFLG